MATTQEVLEHHLKCFGGGDLSGIMSDYAPDAVMFTAEGLRKGPDEIRPVFEAFFAEFAKPGAKFSMKRQSVDAAYAYILWTAETADNVYELATDTFVISGGKIVAQTYAAKLVAKH